MQFGLGDDKLGAGVIEDVAEVLAAALHIDRYPDSASPRGRKEKGQRDRAVADHQRDGVAGLEAESAHPDRKRTRHAVELTEGYRHAFVACDKSGRSFLQAPCE